MQMNEPPLFDDACLAKLGGPGHSSILAAAAQRLGFDHLSYIGLIYPPMSRPTVLEADNLPADWKLHRRSLQLPVDDPLLTYAHAHSKPVAWDDPLLQNPASYWHEARRHGLSHGCSIPLWTRHGCIGLVSFSRQHPALPMDEYLSKVEAMSRLGQQIHHAMLTRHVPALAGSADAALSERERTVLKWTADGKTSSEVATILGLTQRTINFHIGKAACKLNSTNKTQAALKAALLGLLF